MGRLPKGIGDSVIVDSNSRSLSRSPEWDDCRKALVTVRLTGSGRMAHPIASTYVTIGLPLEGKPEGSNRRRFSPLRTLSDVIYFLSQRARAKTTDGSLKRRVIQEAVASWRASPTGRAWKRMAAC